MPRNISWSACVSTDCDSKPFGDKRNRSVVSRIRGILPVLRVTGAAARTQTRRSSFENGDRGARSVGTFNRLVAEADHDADMSSAQRDLHAYTDPLALGQN